MKTTAVFWPSLMGYTYTTTEMNGKNTFSDVGGSLVPLNGMAGLTE